MSALASSRGASADFRQRDAVVEIRVAEARVMVERIS